MFIKIKVGLKDATDCDEYMKVVTFAFSGRELNHVIYLLNNSHIQMFLYNTLFIVAAKLFRHNVCCVFVCSLSFYLNFKD